MFFLIDAVLKRARSAPWAALCLPWLVAMCICVSSVHAQNLPPVRLALIESLSGPFANTGESVWRNIAWGVERVNERGGVTWGGERRPLRLERYDNKGQVEESLAALRAAIDDGARIVLQGNSSAVAAALIDAIDKHNQRDPARQVVFLNYSAVDPVLTNARCSYWHFRFDAHADMRLRALLSVLRNDREVSRAYLIGQDYSFGQSVLREARRQLSELRPDIAIVGDELHPLGRVRDFLPYAQKIKASGAQAVITGNWGNDLTLLVKAAREVGFEGKFYTFYGNALGAPAAIGEAGLGRVIAVADWLPNLGTPESDRFVEAFRQRFPKPADDYLHLRMQLMIEALVQAMARAASPSTLALAHALEGVDVTVAGQRAQMRAADHQVQQPLVVGVMDRVGTPGVKFDVEGSGFGFRVVRRLTPAQAEMPHACVMTRP
jgi:branched-chain amino acid transport system substrate-binding protein